jgi:hypothetical protein
MRISRMQARTKSILSSKRLDARAGLQDANCPMA